MKAESWWCWFMALAVTGASPCTASDRTAVIDDPAYAKAQQRVFVETGRAINLYCRGAGSPTVIFESGLGSSAAVWGFVQPSIANHTRACSYDRAGIGFSDSAKRPSTSANGVEDLHRALAAASIPPPYVLVGHSSGALNARLYADLYPGEVAGLVLVDPTMEDWPQVFWRVDPEQRPWRAFWNTYYSADSAGARSNQECVVAATHGLKPDTKAYTTCIPPPDARIGAAINAALTTTHEAPAFQAATASEGQAVYDASADQLRKARRWYGNMPLIILTSPFHAARDGETQAHRNALNHAWTAFYDQTAALSTRGEIRAVANTDHAIQLAQPGAVIGAILDVLNQSDQKMTVGVESRSN